jgi:uncharacterized protein (UPF0332 family)
MDFWGRAVATFRTAKAISGDNDSLANRCYYAAFHTVSALFALEGKTFQSHAGVQAAVHRDLVRPGLWPRELGAEYSFLLKSRMKADYGGGLHVLDDEAARALEAVRQILIAVHESRPDIFPLDVWAEDDKNG